MALCAIVVGLAPALCAAPPNDGPTFEVRVAPGVLAEPFTGRVLVFLSKTLPEPRTWNNPARLEPIVAADFVDARGPFVIDASNAVSFPVAPAELEGGVYRAQAVLDVARHHPRPGVAPGNPCSAPLQVELRRGGDERFVLTCDGVVPPRAIEQTRWTRLFELESQLLTQFHGRPTKLRALVHLPGAWHDEPERTFPVHWFLSGFGASIDGFESVDWPARELEGEPTLMVYPDPSCASGHHGFANSASNGPWGDAFVYELVPALERAFRGAGARDARFLVGHSSGGWAALWLMATYPNVFGYAWAGSPDPVDFRDFMGVDLYAQGANLFVDENGDPRPFCELGGAWTVGYTREQAAFEQVLRGGVLGYFEALFGPRGPDGRPARLYDRETGAVDADVAQAWSRYDLGKKLRTQWDELGPKLDGRVAITMGNRDNFLLQGAVELLRDDLAELGANVRIRVLAGDHFSIRSHEPDSDVLRAMIARYRAWRDGEERSNP